MIRFNVNHRVATRVIIVVGTDGVPESVETLYALESPHAVEHLHAAAENEFDRIVGGELNDFEKQIALQKGYYKCKDGRTISIHNPNTRRID